LTLGLYWPAVHFDFVNYDDPEYVIYNPAIQHGLNGASLAWALTTRHASNWHPLTWLSLMVDYSLFGLHPGGYHLVNLLLHTANVVLLFLVLWQWTASTWRSALVAALFAYHPLHVESVAWISERKDVLSTLFWLLTMAAYGRYAANLKFENLKSQIWYGIALICFALGLLAKPMLVTLPLILLALDFWPLQRTAAPRIFLEKIPFLILAALDGVATMWAQRGANSVVSLAVLSVPQRMANALVSYVLYLWKTIWPADLAAPYPYSHFWNFGPAAAAGILLLSVSVLVVWQRRKRPWLLVGWIWFLVSLAPVIGLLQTGFQSMADRYTYVPLIGIFLMAVWAIPDSWAAWPRPGLVFGAVAAGILVFLATGAEVQSQYWRNSVALFSHTIAVTPNNILAEYNLAEALDRQGDTANAIRHYKQAIAIEPNPVEATYNSQPEARFNLGLIYLNEKKWDAAEAQFRACLRIDPKWQRAREALDAALKGKSRARQPALTTQ
jgi:tetratricopeptide (TPR) repeat protein